MPDTPPLGVVWAVDGPSVQVPPNAWVEEEIARVPLVGVTGVAFCDVVKVLRHDIIGVRCRERVWGIGLDGVRRLLPALNIERRQGWAEAESLFGVDVAHGLCERVLLEGCVVVVRYRLTHVLATDYLRLHEVATGFWWLIPLRELCLHAIREGLVADGPVPIVSSTN